MSVCAIVPQKPLAAAKSRLAGVLPAGTRRRLSLELLERVCRVLRASRGVEDVVVMTPDPTVGAFAAACGVRAVPDPAPDLNDALVEMFRALAVPPRGLLVISADLPLLRPVDVADLLAAGTPRTLVVAPSKDAIGTNALLFPPAVTFRPAFGPASLAAHRGRAGGNGLRVVDVHRPGLAFDLDTPADLSAVRFAQAFNSFNVPVTR